MDRQRSALFEAATPALFEANAFRVTGLPVDASPSDIAQRIAVLKRRRLDAAADPRPDGLSGQWPATLEQLRVAEYRLQCPEHRLIDEIFWFWPVADSGSKSDAALQAVTAGDYAVAEKIWKSLVNHPEQGIFAVHNQAVRWLLTALRLENGWKVVEADDKARETLSKCWLYALKRWDRQLGDQLLWARIGQRIRVLYGPRVNPNLGRQLRETLPSALAGINAALTLAHAERSELSLVLMHVRLIRDVRLILPAGQYSEMVVERATKHIRQRLRTATQRQEAEPHRGLDEASELVRKLAEYERLFAVLGCVEAAAVRDLIDEGLRVCVAAAAASNKLTGDDMGMLDLLNKIQRLAKGSWMKSLVHRKLDVGRQAVLVPLHKALAAVGGRAESPAHRYTKFQHDVLPVLTALMADLPLSEEGRSTATDAVAQALRTISIDAWTKDGDANTASAALAEARKYAMSDSLQTQLHEDFGILTGILSEQGVAKRKRPIGGAVWGAGALVLCTLLIIATMHPSKTASQNSDASSATVPSNLAVSGPPVVPAEEIHANADATARIYRVSNQGAGESDRDRRVIALPKELAQQLEDQYRTALAAFHERELEAKQLEQQLHDQSTQNEREWLKVDNSDSAGLENFGSRLERYNSLASRAIAARAASDALLQPLNTLRDRVNAENADVNR